jgi:hypothetical protein
VRGIGREELFICAETIELNNVIDHYFRDDEKLISEIKRKCYLISMICVDDNIEPCAYIA